MSFLQGTVNLGQLTQYFKNNQRLDNYSNTNAVCPLLKTASRWQEQKNNSPTQVAVKDDSCCLNHQSKICCIKCVLKNGPNHTSQHNSQQTGMCVQQKEHYQVTATFCFLLMLNISDKLYTGYLFLIYITVEISMYDCNSTLNNVYQPKLQRHSTPWCMWRESYNVCIN